MKVKDLFEEKFLTISNFLSVSRVLFVPALWFCLHEEAVTGLDKYKYYCLLVLLIISLTDFLDGYIARLLKQVTSLGKFLDPTADKIAITISLILLTIYKDLPLWFVFIIIFRDIFTVIGGLLIFSRKDIQVLPNIFGKMMVCSIGITGVIFILSPAVTISGMSLQTISIIITLTLLLLSFSLYWKTYAKIYFNKNK